MIARQVVPAEVRVPDVLVTQANRTLVASVSSGLFFLYWFLAPLHCLRQVRINKWHLRAKAQTNKSHNSCSADFRVKIAGPIIDHRISLQWSKSGQQNHVIPYFLWISMVD